LSGQWKKFEDNGYSEWHLRIGAYQNAQVREMTASAAGGLVRYLEGPEAYRSVYITKINDHTHPHTFKTQREAIEAVEDALIVTAKETIKLLQG
jgi:hypothetical protein